MPAKDRYHNVVVEALTKAGWSVDNEQVMLIMKERWLWIDLQAHRDDANIILVEVKGFENMPSPVAYLASVVGQYVLYQTALDYLEVDYPLYLAVPVDAADGVLQEALSQQVIKRVNMKLVVFDPVQKEILRWMT
ncbi:MAG: fatty-acid synthase [Anaerolineaceae bacterium]|nr:fatty-acid synthase [Anaerolineaceae bacterium]